MCSLISEHGESQPRAKSLFGLSVVITRPYEQGLDFGKRLKELGATPLYYPAIKIITAELTEDIKQALIKIEQADWLIFTSSNGVEATNELLTSLKIAPQVVRSKKIAAIGDKTALALSKIYRTPDVIPEEFLGINIPEAISNFSGGSLEGLNIVLLRADIADQKLVFELNKLGAKTISISVYNVVENLNPNLVKTISEEQATPDVITLTSPSGVRGFVKLLTAANKLEWLKNSFISCVGPVTAKEAIKYEITVDHTAKRYTTDDIISELIDLNIKPKGM